MPVIPISQRKCRNNELKFLQIKQKSVLTKCTKNQTKHRYSHSSPFNPSPVYEYLISPLSVFIYWSYISRAGVEFACVTALVCTLSKLLWGWPSVAMNKRR